jgi:alkanesulfonate monooxygenase SsuD/methylene tetrahydromethanopterin reductase-like flavin-dependent oxidoreductase (luciferase family)
MVDGTISNTNPGLLGHEEVGGDVLSGGRLDLGVGIGWQREEYEAAGLELARRGGLLDHTLEVCQCLWRGSRVGYESGELQFDWIRMMPKPVTSDGVPIRVSGTLNERVTARLARFGAGYRGHGRPPLHADARFARRPCRPAGPPGGGVPHAGRRAVDPDT